MPSGVLVLCSAGVVVVGGEVVENAAKAPKLSQGSSHLSKGNRTKYNSQLGRIASDNRRVQTDPIKWGVGSGEVPNHSAPRIG